MENKWLFQNKWGSSAPAPERAAKRLLGGKGHVNIGLIPLSSCCLQGCSSNIPASCTPRCCKAPGSSLGTAPLSGCPWLPLLVSPRPACPVAEVPGRFSSSVRTHTPFAVGTERLCIQEQTGGYTQGFSKMYRQTVRGSSRSCNKGNSP